MRRDKLALLLPILVPVLFIGGILAIMFLPAAVATPATTPGAEAPREAPAKAPAKAAPAAAEEAPEAE